MICESYSQQGSLHVEYGVANQDAVKTGQAAGYTFAIVCDGVSLKSDMTFSNSEIAARICTKSAASYLKQKLTCNLQPDDMTKLLNETFQFTNSILIETLEKAGIPLFDCQATMIVMVYGKGRLYGGIAGDGGILFLTKQDQISLMMTQVKTSPSVYPISDEAQWRFFTAGDAADPVIAALAATDGIFDALIGLEDGQLAANIEEIHHLFSISSVRRNQRAEWLKKAVEAIPSHDDKTIAILVDTKLKKKLR